MDYFANGEPIYLELFGKPVINAMGERVVANRRQFVRSDSILGVMDFTPTWFWQYERSHTCDICSCEGFVFYEHSKSGIEYCMTCVKNIGVDE